ncbi:MAG: GGDEF domain-containing protein [Planctomycetota bacterium]|nr:GGDEF domain-containing protein [Planctomycetota bacterium]
MSWFVAVERELPTRKFTVVMFEWLNLVGLIPPSAFVLAMSCACVLVHFAHLRRRQSLQMQLLEASAIIDSHDQTLAKVRQEGLIARNENALLREFLSSDNSSRALTSLLRRYVRNSAHDFAAFLEFEPDGSRIVASCGLDSESKSKLTIDAELKRRIAAEHIVTLEGRELFDSPLLSGLGRNDRGKARRLVCIAAGARPDLSGVFLTTAFPLKDVAIERQIELTSRLLECLGRHFAQSQRVSEQEGELQIAAEILALGSIVDRDFRTPITMVRHMLEQLLERFDGFRAALFMLSNGNRRNLKCLAQVGKSPQATLIDMCQTFETRLARRGMDRRDVELLDQTALLDARVDSLFSAALLIPLLQDGEPQGVICVTWQHAKVLGRAEMRLADWCVESLADSILRVTDVAKVHQDAKQDGLTLLANRREFDLQLKRELKRARSESRPCGLLLLDLDHFKSVNDTHGHPAGDEVLRVVADVLRDQVRQVRGNDRILAARYGGEEMAVLLPGFESPGAVRVAESIRLAIAATSVRHEQRTIKVTASIGLAIFPQDGDTASSLLQRADECLYDAKSLGRNRVCVASPSAEKSDRHK